MASPNAPSNISHPATSSEILRLNVAARIPITEAEGPGRRYALWLQGCHLRCPGCCNPQMLTFEDVEWMTAETLAAEICATPDIEGLTVVGGEPFAQARALARVAELVQLADRSVMIFTGYTLRHLKRAQNPDYDQLLAHTDLLVDGPYLERERVTDRRWIGSANQKVHFLTERYAPLRDSETGWDETSNTVEIRISGGTITVNGFPHEDITTLMSKLQRDRS